MRGDKTLHYLFGIWMIRVPLLSSLPILRVTFIYKEWTEDKNVVDANPSSSPTLTHKLIQFPLINDFSWQPHFQIPNEYAQTLLIQSIMGIVGADHYQLSCQCNQTSSLCFTMIQTPLALESSWKMYYNKFCFKYGLGEERVYKQGHLAVRMKARD